ncbi:DUF805 domain-containing protein [Stappia sp. F7233]|uniref:DUF805 domain-containing protein n=1 Tax=Stappia albiluteola TaxID=2758565 RepID=A0A839AB87_9HYPH|nr:DUF805 domain-containing protein [Stappia albiluteola]MBA5776212.1 DUF805 domain-containing protein [Stappia albiluteola]
MLSPVPHQGPNSIFWLLLNPIGRISREPYWLGFALMWALIGIPINIWLRSVDFAAVERLSLEDFVNSNPLIPLLLFATQWVQLALVIKRLQDCGLTGFLAIFTFVPLFNILFIIGLGLIPGEAKPNRYGPGPNSRWRRPGRT